MDRTSRAPLQGPAGTAALSKAMLVLDLVAAAPVAPRFGELAEQSGLPRATLHRLLAAWIDKAMLVQSPDGCYRPGTHLLELASSTWERMDLRVAAAPAIARVHALTQETVHLAILSDDAVVYVDKVECSYPVRLHSAIGKRGPVHCTAVGKVMAAFLDPAEQRRLAERLALERHTPTTLTTRAALAAEFARIRAAGLAFDREEHVTGIHCVAAPVMDFRGRCVAGISLTAPRLRVDMRTLRRYGETVREAALETTRRLGGSATPASAARAHAAGRNSRPMQRAFANPPLPRTR